MSDMSLSSNKDNSDKFVWSDEDIIWENPTVPTTHILSVPARKKTRPTTYKRLGMAPAKKPTTHFNPCHDEQGRFCSGGGGGGGAEKDWSKLEAKGEVLKKLEQGGQSWGEKLTEVERSSIFDYSSYGYKDVNQQLRYGSKKSQDDKISAIDSALNKSKLDKDLVVYRGFKNSHLTDMIDSGQAIGRSFVDKGFVSCSTNLFVAGSAGGSFGQIIATIKLSKGIEAAYIKSVSATPSDNEVLAQRNLKFKIVEASKQGSGMGARYFVKLQAVR